MKVRITKADRSYYWYSNRIGEIFDVRAVKTPHYGLYSDFFPKDAPHGYITADNKYAIDIDDCEIMEDPMQEIKYTPLPELTDNTVLLQVVSIDGCELEMRLQVDYARRFAENLIKRCDELENK